MQSSRSTRAIQGWTDFDKGDRCSLTKGDERKYRQNINIFQKHQQNINDLSTKYQQIINLKNSINIWGGSLTQIFDWYLVGNSTRTQADFQAEFFCNWITTLILQRFKKVRIRLKQIRSRFVASCRMDCFYGICPPLARSTAMTFKRSREDFPVNQFAPTNAEYRDQRILWERAKCQLVPL